jgi:alkyl hydroperoxide reductase subunit AhpC
VTLDSLQFNTVVVLNEKVPTLTRWRAGAHSTLTALADERGEIASVYGLWDNLGSATRHGLYVLDPDGVVRLELLGQKVNAPSLRGLVQTAVEGL